MAIKTSLIPFPDSRDLSAQVCFRQADGKIWLDEQRVVMNSLPALASMRR